MAPANNLRVKAFAKQPLTPSPVKNGGCPPENQDDDDRSDSEIRSLTLTPSEISEPPAKKKKKTARKPKTEPESSKSAKSRTPRRRKLKDETPTTSGKKILDFFKPSAKLPDTPASQLEAIPEPVPAESTSAPTEAKEVEKGPKETFPDPKVSRARRRLCPGTNLHLVSNRYHDDEQSRLSNFYEKTKTVENYFSTETASKLPTIIDGSKNVESFLDVLVTEESRVIDIRDLEPAPDVNVLDRLENPDVMDDRDLEREAWNMERPLVAVENLADATQSDLELAELDLEALEKSAKAKRPQRGRKGRSRVVCPKYKIISGTTFAVDAFRYGKIEGVTHYFLTHFHSDHYIGLKKTFDMPLICSSVTSRLVQEFIRVDPRHIRVVDENMTIRIDDVEIKAVDANHCPGALMFLFKLPNGDVALHTGDFRANPYMEELPCLWNNRITELYLDTTYLQSKYDLISQQECVQQCVEQVRAYREKHLGDKVLVVVGTYLVGKEKVWMTLADVFGMRVWADKNRRLAIEAIRDPNMLKFLEPDPKKAGLHVVNMGIVSYDDLKSYLDNFPDTFTHVLGLKPSGWSHGSRPRHQGNVSVVGIEYSEHSSYAELRRFVGFTRPTTIISTVPTGKDPNVTPTIPIEWYRGDLKPNRGALQSKINQVLPVVTPKVLERLKKEDKTPLNPSAKKRRQDFNRKMEQLEVLETIDLDLD